MGRQEKKKIIISEKVAAKILYEILCGIKACHKAWTAHRDLKPENILFTSMNDDDDGGSPNLKAVGFLKIADFGCSKDYKIDPLKTLLGTARYMAPEIFQHNEYTQRCDVWSIGVIAFRLFTGTYPFQGGSDQALIHSITKATPDFGLIVNRGHSKKATNFTSQLLNKNSKPKMGDFRCVECQKIMCAVCDHEACS